MGAMNAGGHLLAVAAGGSLDDVWDFLRELSHRLGHEPPAVHAFEPGDPLPRYCVHPTGHEDIEFRGDTLRTVLLEAAGVLVQAMPADELWRRD